MPATCVQPDHLQLGISRTESLAGLPPRWVPQTAGGTCTVIPRAAHAGQGPGDQAGEWYREGTQLQQ